MNIEEKLAAGLADKTKLREALDELLDTNVIALVPPGQADVNAQNTQLQLVFIQDSRGAAALPFFTDKEHIKLLGQGIFSFVTLPCKQLFKFIEGRSAVLNPNYKECTKVFHPFEMKVLLLEHKEPEKTA